VARGDRGKLEGSRALTRVGGAALSAYLGSILGPEAGATAGQSIVEAADVAIDWLERRSRDRVEWTLGEVSEQVGRRRSRGDTAREDIGDPESEEAAALLELVVEAAARSAERRKCRVIANVYASIAFEPAVSATDAMLYLRRVRDASWRQLVALRYCEDPERKRERALIGVAGDEGDARIHPALSAELSEAARALELIGIGQDGGSVANPANVMDGGQITSSSVSRLRATGLGETVARLGRLSDVVTSQELDQIAHELRSDERP
jgi:hypothetical protein